MGDPGDERLSFGGVAERYSRGRPGYPPEAVAWLVGPRPLRVLELGAGTGQLTERLVALGHEVVATDPDPRMLRHLVERVPGAHVCTGTAEQIPLPSRSVDVVVAAQSFHWFDRALAVPEVARVLRPEGVLAMVWNDRDEQVPWVRRLGRLIGTPPQETDPVVLLAEDRHFGWVDTATYRHWQTLGRPGLLDLVASRSHVATMDQDARDVRLGQVSALYDEYGRGPDGMSLPYVARCYRTVVQVQDPEPEPAHDSPDDPHDEAPAPVEDTGTLLIDFR